MNDTTFYDFCVANISISFCDIFYFLSGIALAVGISWTLFKLCHLYFTRKWKFTTERLSASRRQFVKFFVDLFKWSMALGGLLLVVKYNTTNWLFGFLVDKFLMVFAVICVIAGLGLADSAPKCFHFEDDEEQQQVIPPPPRENVQHPNVQQDIEIVPSRHFDSWLKLLRSNNEGELRARAAKLANNNDQFSSFLNDLTLIRKYANTSAKLDKFLLILSEEFKAKCHRGSLP